ncbi:MAG: KH domain-containing protein [Clostridia bacterium]|nr:KH domain-containing protein [Clostridia bacterium]
MQELLTFMAESLVDHPEQVRVQTTEGPEGVILELNVAEEDMGKVIGKQGRIAKAIRTVIRAATPKDSNHVFVEIQRPMEDTMDPEDSE